MRKAQDQVAAFHEHTGQPIREVPTLIDAEEARYRRRIMDSEHDELNEAMQEGDMTMIADGLGDLLYTILGTAVAYGMDLASIFEEIHRSNMTKTCNPEQGQFGAAKPIKGPNFEPPRLAELLLAQRFPSDPLA